MHIIEQMKYSEHLVLMFDETTDCTVMEQLEGFIDALIEG